jgi:hypothetical protein
LEGCDQSPPDCFKLMRTRVSEDDKFILWMRGKSDISIVCIESFSARHIHNFWNFKSTDASAIAVAVDNLASAIVGIGVLPGEVQTVHVYEGGDSVSVFQAYDILPEVNSWLCLEISKAGDVFFIAGA